MQYREYVRHVDGSPMAVLMIHGIMGSPAHFRPFLPLIPEDWSVYNILLDGHGGTAKDFARTSMKKWQAQVAEQVDRILACHRRLIIFGHSMGALFGIEAALRYPDRVAQLFCHGTPMAVHTPPATLVSAWQVIFRRVRPGTMAEKMQMDCGVHLTRNLLRYIPCLPRFGELLSLIRRVRPEVRRLQVDCISLLGDHDELVSRRSRKYLSGCPTVRQIDLPLSGHFRFEPEELAQVQALFSQIIEKCR